jgi:hypothetical protein
LVVQDYLGGELKRSVHEGVSHYWNSVPGIGEIDLTEQQFATPVDRASGEVRARAYALSFPHTAQRYDRLRQRVADELRQGGCGSAA